MSLVETSHQTERIRLCFSEGHLQNMNPSKREEGVVRSGCYEHQSAVDPSWHVCDSHTPMSIFMYVYIYTYTYIHMHVYFMGNLQYSFNKSKEIFWNFRNVPRTLVITGLLSFTDSKNIPRCDQNKPKTMQPQQLTTRDNSAQFQLSQRKKQQCIPKVSHHPSDCDCLCLFSTLCLPGRHFWLLSTPFDHA